MNKKQMDEFLFPEIKRQYAELKEQNKKMHEVLIMGMSAIIKHGSYELVEKYTSLIKEIDNESKS